MQKIFALASYLSQLIDHNLLRVLIFPPWNDPYAIAIKKKDYVLQLCFESSI
jgi:hypothetical protein